MQTHAIIDRLPRTDAARRTLRAANAPAMAADLLFLEAWETNAPRDLATLLRAGQIRRTNPKLVAEIKAELKA